MKWSQTHLYTLKEAPSDADILSQQLFIRGGMIKKLAPGIFTYGPIFLRALRKFEALIREELNQRGGIEVLMPMVQPRELWEETQRWDKMGDGLLKFKNRNDQWFCLGATHEEAVTDYVRFELRSHRDLPKLIYQIQTKYRDEIRPRFGLMRGREFVMKDAYSFDPNREQALKSYWSMYEAYQSIFDRLGVQYRIVQADAGNIGGSLTHEFQLLAEAGEDHLMISDQSSFAANIEVCPATEAIENQITIPSTGLPIEKFATPRVKTIDQLSQLLTCPSGHLVKTLFFATQDDPEDYQPIAVLIRGDHELNPIKLKNKLGLAAEPKLLTDQEVKKVTGAWPGSCGPVGLTIPIYMDQSLSLLGEMIVGANEDGYHLKHVQPGRDFNATLVADLRFAKVGDQDPESPSGRLRSVRGIEVGHVFYLGTQYAESMNAKFADKDQTTKAIEMGCYGIGVTRTLQAIIEQNHDANGMIWPLSVTPFHVHVCVLDIRETAILEWAQQFETQLASQGIEVFVDDRDERPGVKFKDADLLGFPLRVTLGKKGFERGIVEVVERKNQVKQEWSLQEAVKQVITWKASQT